MEKLGNTGRGRCTVHVCCKSKKKHCFSKQLQAEPIPVPEGQFVKRSSRGRRKLIWHERGNRHAHCDNNQRLQSERDKKRHKPRGELQMISLSINCVCRCQADKGDYTVKHPLEEPVVA